MLAFEWQTSDRGAGRQSNDKDAILGSTACSESLSGSHVENEESRPMSFLPIGSSSTGMCWFEADSRGLPPPLVAEFVECLSRAMWHARKEEMEASHSAMTAELRAPSTGSSGFYWEDASSDFAVARPELPWPTSPLPDADVPNPFRRP